MTILIKIMTFLWPFIREMALGGQSVKESLKNNKRGLINLMIIMLLLFFLMVLGKASIKLYMEKNELQSKIEQTHLPEKKGPDGNEKKKQISQEDSDSSDGNRAQEFQRYLENLKKSENRQL